MPTLSKETKRKPTIGTVGGVCTSGNEAYLSDLCNPEENLQCSNCSCAPGDVLQVLIL